MKRIHLIGLVTVLALALGLLPLAPARDASAALPAAAESAPAVPAPAAEQEVRLALVGTPLRGTELFGDGGVTNAAGFDVGAQADYLRAFGAHLRWGAGVRYEYGSGTANPGSGRDGEHLVFVPILLGAFWRWPGGQEIEVLAGLGPAAGRFTSQSPGGRAALDTFGVGGELGVSYLQPLTDRLALQLGIAVRGAALKNVNSPSSETGGAGAYHGEIPLVVGLRFRL